jgi:hypothetical protein
MGSVVALATKNDTSKDFILEYPSENLGYGSL